MYFFNVHATRIRLLFVMKCAAAAASAACLEVRLVAEWSNMIAPPPPNPFVPFSFSYSRVHTQTRTQVHARTHTHSLRKSCFIYETYGSESHRVLLRFRDCSHTHSHAAGHAFALSAVLARQKHSCFSVTSVFLCSAWMAAS